MGCQKFDDLKSKTYPKGLRKLKYPLTLDGKQTLKKIEFP